MALIVSDDYNAINAASVVAVNRPMDALAKYLLITSAGCPQITVWFEKIDGRDTFYKELIDAMQKDA